MPAPLRKKLFVDPRVQGALMMRAVLYWFCCIVSITMFILCWRIVTGPARVFYTHFDELWFQMGPGLIASLLILPLVLVDVLRLSNRFVGPFYRIRQTMQRLAKGEKVTPVMFREGDFWQEVAEELNAVIARLNVAEANARPTAKKEQPATAATQNTSLNVYNEDEMLIR